MALPGYSQPEQTTPTTYPREDWQGLFFDSADAGKLKRIDDTGTVVDLEVYTALTGTGFLKLTSDVPSVAALALDDAKVSKLYDTGGVECAAADASGNVVFDGDVSVTGALELLKTSQALTSVGGNLRTLSVSFTDLSTDYVSVGSFNSCFSLSFIGAISLNNIDADRGVFLLSIGLEQGVAVKVAATAPANCAVSVTSNRYAAISGLGDGRTYTLQVSTNGVSLKADSLATGTTTLSIFGVALT